MKNKKLVGLVLVGLLAVGGIAGGTLAYFTDSKEATNVITMGKVAIDLTEPNFEADKKIENVKPNQVITKDPTITVKADSNDAYVRATISFSDALTKIQQDELLANIVINNGWKLENGYYYYNKALAAGESAVLFDEVKIPETWDNTMASKTFEINVKGEAIQKDSFTPATDVNGFVTGWFYSDGSAVVAK
ncbi:MAG: TasA family protein [Longicatena sp.]